MANHDLKALTLNHPSSWFRLLESVFILLVTAMTSTAWEIVVKNTYWGFSGPTEEHAVITAERAP
jgi:hypothetical protein